MKQTIHVSIDSNGRAKASTKNLGNQYETGVAEFEIDLSSDWQDESYFYYLVVIPPESTGIKQYAVPLTRDFIYLISSNITWYLGTFKFLIIVMNQELDASGQIPTEGVVSISDEWEGEVSKSSLKLAELAEQPENPNFTLLYTDLMTLRNSVEKIGNYAQTQGDYAKSVGEQLLLDKEKGIFNGKDGANGVDGQPGKDGTDGEKGDKGEKGEPGEPGVNGKDGVDGFSPIVSVKTDTDAQYILEVIYKDENGDIQTFETPNLKGKDGQGGGTSGNVPTKLSELTNDTGFITNTVNNLVNYYLKTEIYDKNEINSLIGNLTSLNTLIVTELPTENISTSTIYLIKNTEQAENNYYDEYLYINGAWERIGTTQVNIDYGGKASSNPIGTIIPFMGTTPPKYYLICDGSVLNIADYLELANHFEAQFGTKNHFGGDGTTTFAVPDLRNQFLRGYHNSGEKQLSGEVGIHQAGTIFPHLTPTTDNGLYQYTDLGTDSWNIDDKIMDNGKAVKFTGTKQGWGPEVYKSFYARPTNVAVLFCIKYTVSSEEIEIESTPTEGSNKLVTSDGVKKYVDGAVTGALGGAY